MKKWLYLIFLFPTLLGAEEQALELKVPKGFASNYDALNLRDDLAKDAQNVFFDGDLGVGKRGGYARENSVSLGSQTIKDMYGFIPSTLTVSFSTNSTEYLVLFAGSTMAYSLGVDSFTIVITTLNVNYNVDCAKLGGRLWCVNGDRKFAWVGGTTTIDLDGINFPVGTMIESHADRLWVGGVPGDESSVYASAFNNGLSWIPGGGPSDPLIIPIGSRDGNTLSCMKSFSDALILGKRGSPGSLWGIVGKTQEDFTKKNLSEQVGCADDRSVREKQGKLYWLSERGIERFAGGLSDPPFGDPIKDWTDGFLTGNAISNQSLFTDSTQSDFQQMVSTSTDLDSQPGTVQISSPTVFLSSTPSSQYISWRDPATYTKGKIVMKIIPQITSRLLEASSQLVVFNHISSAWTFSTFITTANQDITAGQPPIGRIASFVASSPTIPNILDGQSIAVTLNTVFPSSTVLTAGTTYWIGWFIDGPGSTNGDISIKVAIPSMSNYPAYQSSNQGNTWVGAPTLLMDLIYSSAAITSPVKDLGANVSRMGNFTGSQVLNDGAIFYYVKSAASEDALKTTGWTAQTLGSPFATATNRFVQWSAEFSRFVSSQNPQLQEISLAYFTTTNKPKVASWIVDGRYYLSGSTNTFATTTNETVIVVDKFDNFTKLNGMNAASFADAFGRTYFGTSISSGAQSGLYYRMTDSFSDDGRIIDAFIRSKDYCPIDCSMVKNFSRMYVKTKNDGASGGILSSSVEFDRDGSRGTLGDISLTEATGLIIGKIPFPLGDYGVKGKAVNFQFRNAQLNHDLRYYGGTVYFMPEPAE